MADILTWLKKRIKGEGPGPYKAGENQIVCPHCQHKEFTVSRSGYLFKNKPVAVLVCSNCSQIQWFGKRPERIQNPGLS